MRMMRIKNDNKIIYPELSYQLNGVLFEAKRRVGRFGNEKQCCDAIEALLQERKISYVREKILPESFESEKPGRHKIDYLIDNKIILEVKTKPFVTKNDYYQCMRYLAAMNLKLCILVNMRPYYIRPKRILNSNNQSPHSHYTNHSHNSHK